ncbi:MAG TPA: cytochrome c [Thermoanaerobaculia bacterium]|nr:cytochrome c [Thermoanaerobaculia bacterium]
MSIRARRFVAPLMLGGGLVLGGCRQDMHDQPRYEPLEASKFFADGMASRQLPEGTVARGHLGEDVAFSTGKDAAGNVVAELPMPATRQLLERGHQRFDVYCSPCHGRLGDGQGMAVRRGFKQPPSFHDDRLVNSPVGYYFDVMTHGFGVMPSYAPSIPPEDRWAIAAYVRALQLSQRAHLADLEPTDRAGVDQAAAAAAAPPAAEAEEPGEHH